MWLTLLFIMILIVALKYKDFFNNRYNQPTSEELEAYQDAVFLHIEDEIQNYKNDINLICEEKSEPLKKEIKDMLNEFDKKIFEYSELEKRLDEKIIKLKNYTDLIK